MKSHTVHLTMNVPARMDFVNITGQVEKVFINDDEPGLHQDYKKWLEWLAPYDPSPEGTITIVRARTTATPTTSARSWAARSWWR